jgi:hypothetical protein
MATFNFGQPEDSIIQTAYVVPNLRAAIDHWVAKLTVGPWFLAEHFEGLDPRYRREPSHIDVSIAMAYSGAMCIELIEQHDERPSVFREVILKRGYGFHHWGVGTRRFEHLSAKHSALGHHEVFTDQVPGGGRIAYRDTTSSMPGMIEIIEVSPFIETLFSRFHGASAVWDGTDPLRSF